MTLNDFVKQRMTLSELMEGREKGDTSDLINKEVTIRDFDIVETGNDKYGVYIIDEEPEKFFFAGLVLTDIFTDIAEAYGETYKNVINKEGLRGVIKTEKSKSVSTRNNMKNNYTTFIPTDSKEK